MIASVIIPTGGITGAKSRWGIPPDDVDHRRAAFGRKRTRCIKAWLTKRQSNWKG